MSHGKIMDEKIINEKIMDGLRKAHIVGLKGALHRAAQALQDAHADAGRIGVNDEAATALANASEHSGRAWDRALAQAKEELASRRVWP